MFSDPSSRLYWPLLLSSGLFAFAWIRYRGQNINLVDLKKAFIHKDSLIDISLLITNLTIKGLLFSMIVLSATNMALPAVMKFHDFFPYFEGVNLGSFSNKLLLTLIVLVIDDFLRFSHHFLMHKLLWSIHSVHHSAKKLTPLTLFRTHPFESIMAQVRSVLAHSTTIFLITVVFKDQMGVIDFLGVNIFGFIFNATLANLRHSSIPVSFGILEYIFISPRMHQIHHSNEPKHFNKNYGVIFSLWDQLAGSFYKPTTDEMNNISYGVLPLERFQGIAKVTPALTSTNPIISS